MEATRMSKKRFIFNILAILTRIIRSIFFNIFMMILGFVLGITAFKTVQYNKITRTSDYQCIESLKQHLEEQRNIDNRIDNDITEIVKKLMINHKNQ